jgi:hypothetical protein
MTKQNMRKRRRPMDIQNNQEDCPHPTNLAHKEMAGDWSLRIKIKHNFSILILFCIQTYAYIIHPNPKICLWFIPLLCSLLIFHQFMLFFHILLSSKLLFFCFFFTMYKNPGIFIMIKISGKLNMHNIECYILHVKGNSIPKVFLPKPNL